MLCPMYFTIPGLLSSKDVHVHWKEGRSYHGCDVCVRPMVQQLLCDLFMAVSACHIQGCPAILPGGEALANDWQLKDKNASLILDVLCGKIQSCKLQLSDKKQQGQTRG